MPLRSRGRLADLASAVDRPPRKKGAGESAFASHTSSIGGASLRFFPSTGRFFSSCRSGRANGLVLEGTPARRRRGGGADKVGIREDDRDLGELIRMKLDATSAGPGEEVSTVSCSGSTQERPFSLMQGRTAS